MSIRHHHTADYFRQCFRYDNGVLYWLARPVHHFVNVHGQSKFNAKRAGTVAGHQRYDRWIVSVDGRHYRRARIVWMLHHGEWPLLLDHKNRIASDDRIDNLRVGNKSLNAANTVRKTGTASGYKGVSKSRGKMPWRARVRKDGKEIIIGYFSDPKEAHKAYCLAAKESFGDFFHNGE